MVGNMIYKLEGVGSLTSILAKFCQISAIFFKWLRMCEYQNVNH